MLMPLPSTLRRLLTEYEALLTATRSTLPSRRLSDLEYTLCVSTGTREIAQALEAARSYLATRTGTSTAVGGKREVERAADASPEAPALMATVFQHEIGVPQRSSGEPHRPRPAAPPVAATAQGRGQ